MLITILYTLKYLRTQHVLDIKSTDTDHVGFLNQPATETGPHGSPFKFNITFLFLARKTKYFIGNSSLLHEYFQIFVLFWTICPHDWFAVGALLKLLVNRIVNTSHAIFQVMTWVQAIVIDDHAHGKHELERCDIKIPQLNVNE